MRKVRALGFLCVYSRGARGRKLLQGWPSTRKGCMKASQDAGTHFGVRIRQTVGGQQECHFMENVTLTQFTGSNRFLPWTSVSGRLATLRPSGRSGRRLLSADSHPFLRLFRRAARRYSSVRSLSSGVPDHSSLVSALMRSTTASSSASLSPISQAR